MKIVNKIILGFAGFGVLLLITNFLSYLGLSQIRDSAQTVVQEKVPVQSQMLTIQTGILTLAKVSTSGFYKGDAASLDENLQEFNRLADDFEKQLATLGNLLGSNNTEFAQGKEQARVYIQQTKAMYQSRSDELQLAQQLESMAAEIISVADEASVLIMDLSYMESDAPNFQTLIGTGNSIDNKIVPIMNSTKEYISVIDAENSANIRGDLEFTLSNIDVESQYLNRLAEQINTDGIVDSFNQEYASLKTQFSKSNGLFDMQERRISLITDAVNQMEAAGGGLEKAITAFSSLFSQVNNDSLQGQHAILDEVESNIWQSVATTLFALLAVILLGTKAARSIAIPLARINRSLRIISSGDLTHKANNRGKDEFSVLANSVNSLTESLHNVVSQIIKQEKALESATTASVDLGERTLKQVDLQCQQVNQTAKDTNKIRATSQSNLLQIQRAMTQLDEANQQSHNVSELVIASTKQIGEQAEQSKASSEVVHRLDENSHKIGSILDVIKTIAEQTNLLALNAAIEAARAGEQGRGFAVVADEVRTLATRTQNSTEEIEAMIDSLQKDAKQAVHAINIGAEQAQQSVSKIEQVNEQVETISTIIASLNKINQQIVQDTGEQDNLLQNVADSLTKIVELAEQSADSTQQSNEATNQIDYLMDELNQAVKTFTLHTS